MDRVVPLSDEERDAALSTVTKTEWQETVRGITLDGINIPFSVLEELDEQDSWDTDMGAMVIMVPYQMERVLKKYGLVIQRTRGSVYGSPALRDLLKRVYN